MSASQAQAGDIGAQVPEFAVEGEFIAYASPESTYAVTRRLMEAADRSITVGITEFSAPQMRDVLAAAIGRGVKVTVVFDQAQPGGQHPLVSELARLGCFVMPISAGVANAEGRPARWGQRVVVIDEMWTLVQSGNYTEGGIPRNELDGGDPARPQSLVPGNREIGVAVRAPDLAAYFLSLIGQAAGAARAGTASEAPPAAPRAAAVMVHRPVTPPKLFPSQSFRPRQPIRVVPALSPDNYLDVVLSLLATAQLSIEIEQQSICTGHPAVRKLLAELRAAMDRNPKLAVRIVLARPLGGADDAELLRGLAEYGLKPGAHLRYLNPRFYAHCHNRLILVDGQTAVIGSQGWTERALCDDRGASLVLYYPALARYCAGILAQDWRLGMTSLTQASLLLGGARTAAPPVPIAPADYVEE